MQGIVRHDAGVPGAEAVWHPAAEVQLLFHQHDGVFAVLLRFRQLFHDEFSVGIGAVRHLGVIVVQVRRGVLDLAAQRLFQLVGRQGVGVGALLREG